MVKTGARKRGRPRRDSSAQNASGIAQQVRNDLNSIIGVCQTCNRPLHSVAPIAEKIGVSAVVLAGFIKGQKGLSLETFDRVYGWIQDYKENPVPLNSDEAVATEEVATA